MLGAYSPQTPCLLSELVFLSLLNDLMFCLSPVAGACPINLHPFAFHLALHTRLIPGACMAVSVVLHTHSDHPFYLCLGYVTQLLRHMYL